MDALHRAGTIVFQQKSFQPLQYKYNQCTIQNFRFYILLFVFWHSMLFVCNSVHLGMGKVIVITVHLGVGRAGIFKESPRNKAVNCEERLLYRPQIWTLNALSLNEVRQGHEYKSQTLLKSTDKENEVYENHFGAYPLDQH